MRASNHNQHLAGAERIVAEADVSETVRALTVRAMNCSCEPVSEVHCNVERIDPATIHYKCLPDIMTYNVLNWQEGRFAAASLLAKAGVRSEIVDRAMQLMADGAGPGGTVMRGAVIMDVTTGERLEPETSRGVRVSRMDVSSEWRPQLERELTSAGLFHRRISEAVVLAGKVLGAPGIVAEICWSDDPEYLTGYVADPQGGYQRISILKKAGDALGGRVFFVDMGRCSLEGLVKYLEKQTVIFNASGKISPAKDWVTRDD